MRRPSQEGQAHVHSPINPAGVAHYNVPLHDSASPARPGLAGRRPPHIQAQPPCASDMSSPSTRQVRKWPGGTLSSKGTMCLLRLSAVSLRPMHPTQLRQDHPPLGFAEPPGHVSVPHGMTCPLREWLKEVEVR